MRYLLIDRIGENEGHAYHRRQNVAMRISWVSLSRNPMPGVLDRGLSQPADGEASADFKNWF
jgi:hypothetical protein